MTTVTTLESQAAATMDAVYTDDGSGNITGVPVDPAHIYDSAPAATFNQGGMQFRGVLWREEHFKGVNIRQIAKDYDCSISLVSQTIAASFTAA